MACVLFKKYGRAFPSPIHVRCGGPNELRTNRVCGKIYPPIYANNEMNEKITKKTKINYLYKLEDKFCYLLVFSATHWARHNAREWVMKTLVRVS